MRRFLLLLLAFPAAVHAGKAEEFQRELARGLVLLETGKHAEALVRLETAHRLDPARLDVLVRMAALELRLGRDEAAEQHLRAALARDAKQPDALRELGALLLLLQRRVEAIEVLQRAVAVAPRDGATRYYLGLAHHQLRRDPEARAALLSAPPLAPVLLGPAHFYVGLSYLRAGEAERAREHLALAARESADPETAEHARQTLAELRSRGPTPAKRFDLRVALGAAYDSNVSMLPDLAGDLPLPVGISLVSSDATLTTAAAGRLFTEIAVEGRPIAGRHSVGLGAGFYQSKHVPDEVSGAFDPPSFDLTAMGAYAFYAFTAQAGTMPLQVEAAAGFTQFLLDSFRNARNYLGRPWLRPGLSLAYARWGTLRLSYQVAYENYADGNQEGTIDDRDGHDHLAQLDAFFLVGPRIDLRLSLAGGFFGADGDQWDALLTGAAVEAKIRIFSWLAMEIGLDYLHRDFGNSRYATTTADLQVREVKRVDDRIAGFGRMRFEIGGFQIGVLYTYMRNISSAKQIFDYTRHIAGVEAGFRY